MLTQLIFDWAEKTPDKVALDYNGEAWSYRIFSRSIARARGHLYRHGIVGYGVAVLAVHNLRDFWVLSLALRSLGLTTVAVQTAEAVGWLPLPALRCVITCAAESWPGLETACTRRRVTLLVADGDNGPALGLDEGDRTPPGGHILQTSGTTGAYKLVLFDPSFELEFLRIRREVSGVNGQSVVCLIDFGGWTGVGYKSPASAWAVGASVVIFQGRPPHLALHRSVLTHLTVVPILLATILAQPQDAFPRRPKMQLSITGGTITQAQINEAKARITTRLRNSLGATEVNAIASTPLDTLEDHRWHRLVPALRIEIVDEFDRPVEIGQLGRLRVGTENGPTSYLHDEEATKAFFKDGFFYPGDLAVMREDGRIALQGRVTDVINISGDKVAPAPIEDRLREAFGVSGVCLISMQDNQGVERMHVVIEASAPIHPQALTTVLSRELQGFVRVHFVAALPRNAMGKVLRRELTTQLVAWAGRNLS